MKFTMQKKMLYPYLQYASSFTSPKNLSQILQNILIEVYNGKLSIKATNFQVYFSCEVECDVEENGILTVDAKKITEIVKELPDSSEIVFTFDGSRLHIKSGRSYYHLATMDPDIFPTWNDVSPEYSFSIDGDKFLDIFKKTVFVISNDTTKIEYCGAYLNVFGNKIDVTTADYTRLATTSIEIDKVLADEFLVNIPKKTVTELLKIFDGAQSIQVDTDKKQIMFTSNNIKVVSKLHEKYIKTMKKLFNDEYSIKATLKKDDLYNAIKRVKVVANVTSHGVLFNFANDKLTLSTTDNEEGKGQEQVDMISFNSENFDISFNANQLLEIISYITTENVIFTMRNAISPALVLPESGSTKYLVVPVSTLA